MFYYLNGKLTYTEPTFAVLDVGGVGYKLTVSGTTLDALPSRAYAGEAPTVKLYTYLAVREDDLELFGFATQTELASFKLLISVSGVGPKAAMSILSLLTPEKFALAVCTGDQKALSKANGIGAKTAARIILELKDKMMKESGNEGFSAIAGTSSAPAVKGSHSKLNEAVDALTVLGYSRPEAINAIKDLDMSNMELEEIIRLSLKKMAKF